MTGSRARGLVAWLGDTTGKERPRWLCKTLVPSAWRTSNHVRKSDTQAPQGPSPAQVAALSVVGSCFWVSFLDAAHELASTRLARVSGSRCCMMLNVALNGPGFAEQRFGAQSSPRVQPSLCDGAARIAICGPAGGTRRGNKELQVLTWSLIRPLRMTTWNWTTPRLESKAVPITNLSHCATCPWTAGQVPPDLPSRS